VTLKLSRLRDRTYAAAEASFARRPLVWVGTTLPGATDTMLSARPTDTVARPPQREPLELPWMWFPDLLKITMSDHPKLKDAVNLGLMRLRANRC
jgi:hypothetical protein